MTILHRWEHRKMSIVWVMLTTAPGGDRKKLRVDLWELERRVQRKTGIEKIEHAVVDTTEGNGVLHILWAAETSLYVEQAWLSEEWGKIHGATYVWINRYRRGTKGRLSRYMVSQYMSGQKGAGVRISWSWKTTFTVPIRAAWRMFKRAWHGESFKGLIAAWERFLCGETVNVGGYRFSLLAWKSLRVLIESEGGWESTVGVRQ
jgi:hypothetical protein